MRRPPPSLVAARRALLVAAVAFVVAVVSTVVAVRGGDDGEDSDTAQSVTTDQARNDAAAARADAELAAAKADEAVAMAAAAEDAFNAALAATGAGVSPELISGIESRLEDAAATAALAMAMANEALETVRSAGSAHVATDDDPPAPEEDPPASEEDPPAPADDTSVSEPDDTTSAEESSTSQEAPQSEDPEGPLPGEDPPAPEPDDPDPAAELPGEPFELAPDEGAALAVVGVQAASALNVRDVPNGTVIARLDNVMSGVRNPSVYVRQPATDDIIVAVDLDDGVVATGNARRLPTTIWYEFRVGELTGWSTAAHFGQLGVTDIVTDQIVESLGETPTADTMVELATVIGGALAGDEPASRVVVSEAPDVFVENQAYVIVDVVGLGDDSILGYRLVVFAHPTAEDWTPTGSGGFTLRSVERTVLCHSHRGVSTDGLCL